MFAMKSGLVVLCRDSGLAEVLIWREEKLLLA